MTLILRILTDELRLLSFRRPSSAIDTQWQAFLAFGLFFTWLAGIGRYWDNPRAELWQYLGLGSVVYVFVLALIIWGLLAPLRPRNWSFRKVLLFITLTAPPAVLYAVPVELFLSPGAAQSANAWFLIIVATWRVALFVVFLRRAAGLSPGAVVVAALLPLVFIVVALTALNLEHVVFDLMSGMREHQRSPNDAAYGVVFMLSVVSLSAAPFLVLAYAFLVFRAWKRVAPTTPGAPT